MTSHEVQQTVNGPVYFLCLLWICRGWTEQEGNRRKSLAGRRRIPQSGKKLVEGVPGRLRYRAYMLARGAFPACDCQTLPLRAPPHTHCCEREAGREGIHHLSRKSLVQRNSRAKSSEELKPEIRGHHPLFAFPSKRHTGKYQVKRRLYCFEGLRGRMPSKLYGSTFSDRH